LTRARSVKLTHRISPTVSGCGGRKDHREVGPARVGEFEIQALEDEQPAFQGGAIDLV